MGELGNLWRGIIMGFAIAAPVGPIGLLCIRRTLEHGPLVGFATGMGAAVADTFYGAVAAFGVRMLIDFLDSHQLAFRLVGGLVLLVVAGRTFRTKPRELDGAPDAATMISGFGTSVVLTLTNPLTIFAFLAIFAGFGVGGLDKQDAATIVLGVFIGSALWWLLLNLGVSRLRRYITGDLFTRINKGAAIALLLCAAYALATAVPGAIRWLRAGG